MKKKLKKFFVVLLVLLLIGGAAAGGAYAYQSYQKENTQTQVFYVSNLSYGYSSDAMTSAGYVTNDYEQSVYLEDKSVVEVKVEEGTKVKIGDPLLVLDTTEEQLQIDMKNLELQKVENDIKIAEKDITELKKRIPGSSTTTNNQSQGNGTSGSGTSGTSGSGTNGTKWKRYEWNEAEAVQEWNEPEAVRMEQAEAARMAAVEMETVRKGAV